MFKGILIVIASGLVWWLSSGVVAWVAAASFLFFGAVVIHGFRELSKPKRYEWLSGDGSYSFDIVGESHYQRELAALAGKKGREAKALECEAEILHEPDNPHDKNACAVFIGGRQVGHLSRADARREVKLRQHPGFGLRAKAMIVGGWKDGRDEGSYGVKLDYVPETRERPN